MGGGEREEEEGGAGTRSRPHPRGLLVFIIEQSRGPACVLAPCLGGWAGWLAGKKRVCPC